MVISGLCTEIIAMSREIEGWLTNRKDKPHRTAGSAWRPKNAIIDSDEMHSTILEYKVDGSCHTLGAATGCPVCSLSTLQDAPTDRVASLPSRRGAERFSRTGDAPLHSFTSDTGLSSVLRL